MSANLTRLGKLEKRLTKCEELVIPNRGYPLKDFGPVCAEIDRLMRSFVEQHPETEFIPETDFESLITESHPQFPELKSGVLSEIHDRLTQMDFPDRTEEANGEQYSGEQDTDDGYDCLRGREFEEDLA
jgi:hypothetical protein